MQKILIGALVLLLLFLAGMNAQLRGRQRDLEERLAAAERKTPRKTAEPVPPVTEPAPARGPAPGAGGPATGMKAGCLGSSGDDAPGGGAKVTNVLDNTVAQASGLQPGDVILEFNGEPVDSLSALSAKIRGAGEGVATTLRIRRGQSEFQQGLQLGSYPK